METQDHPNASIVFNIGAFARKIDEAVFRSIDFAALGLLGSDQLTNDILELPKLTSAIKSTQGPSTSDSRRKDFQRWLLGALLRDVVESVQHALEEASTVLQLFSAAVDGKFRVEDYHRAVSDSQNRFHRLGLPAKLEDLRKKHGFSIATEPEILSMNKLRNCIVHQNGIVSEMDVNCDAGLRIYYRKIKLRISNADGIRELDPPAKVNAGDIISCSLDSVSSKTFSVGDEVTLTTQEFNDLCHTACHFGVLLTEELALLGARAGIPDAPVGGHPV